MTLSMQKTQKVFCPQDTDYGLVITLIFLIMHKTISAEQLRLKFVYTYVWCLGLRSLYGTKFQWPVGDRTTYRRWSYDIPYGSARGSTYFLNP